MSDHADLAQRSVDLDARGWALVNREPRRALDLLREAVDLGRLAGDRAALSSALRHVAFAQYNLGDFDAALAAAREAVALARDLADPFLVAAAVNMQGIAHRYRGELVEALEAQLEHYRLAHQIGHRLMQAHALNNIGSVHLDLGGYEQALEHHSAAAALALELGDDATRLKARNNVAADLQHLGRRDEADRAFEETRRVAHALAFPGEEALALNGLARGALESGDHARARDLAALALDVARAAEDRGMTAEAGVHLGRALAGLGDPAGARTALEEALGLAETAHVHRAEIEALQALARVLETLGRPTDALAALRRAHARELRNHEETAARRAKALGALVEAERFRRQAEEERARAAELAEVNRALREAQARQAELTATLAHQADHDALTGLPNRHRFRVRVDAAVADARRRAGAFALMFLDLDGFKAVNDTLGHHAGDDLLREIAARLVAAVPAGSTVARMGGDEFTVILEGPDVAREIDDLARRLVEVVGAPLRLAGHPVAVTGSVGYALYPEDGPDADDLLRAADAAMYAAKRAGKNRWRRHVPDGEAPTLERLELGAHVRDALERGEFAVHYQGVHRLDDARVVAHEALLRWRHPRHGVLTPPRFLDLVEEAGLLPRVGRWVMARVADEARRRADGTRWSLNVGAVQWTPRLPSELAAVLEETGLDPALLDVEVPERVLLREAPEGRAVLRDLRALSVGVTLDGFGLAPTGLPRLRGLEATGVKVAAALTREAPTREGRAVLEAVVRVAAWQGWTVAAVGVEDATQAARPASVG